MSTATTAAPARPADPYRLKAMEIWGGNTGIDERVVVPGLDAHVVCRPQPGHAEGGDLHYLSTCAAGAISRFVLVDVAGHGASAGQVALSLRSLMRKHINNPNPTKFARSLNEEFGRLSRAGQFATALFTQYFAPTDHLIVCNAGHPRPLLYREATKSWTLFDHKAPGVIAPGQAREVGVGNLPLGIIDGTSYPQFAVRLAPGDILVAYTDAMIEASDAQGRQLGEEGLLGVVRGLDVSRPERMGEALLRAVDDHRGGRPADDDTTLLVLHHNASDPPRMPLGARLKALGAMVGLVR